MFFKRNNMRHFLFFLMLFIWISVSIFNFYNTIFTRIYNFLSIGRLTSQKKHALLEQKNYYNLILFCIENVPKEEDITFINVLADKVPAHSPVWIKGEYYIEKAPFYLFPRKIYRQTSGLTTEYKVYFNPQNDIFVALQGQKIIYANN